MARERPVRVRCQDCDWETSGTGDDTYAVNADIIDHYGETGHTIEATDVGPRR